MELRSLVDGARIRCEAFDDGPDVIKCDSYAERQIRRQSGKVDFFCVGHTNRELPTHLQIDSSKW